MEFKKFTIKGQGVENYKATHYTSDSHIGWRQVYYQFTYGTDRLENAKVTVKDGTVTIIEKAPLGRQKTTIKVAKISEATYKKAKKESEARMIELHGADFKNRGLRWWNDFF